MVKILLSGPVVDQGGLETLFKKVRGVNASKAGPFDYLFIVGQLTHGFTEEAEVQRHLLEGATSPTPIPTYFFDGGKGAGPLGLDDSNSEVQSVGPELYYMGKSGMRTVGKLTVAYVASSATPAECKRIAAMPGYRGADLLLTSDWARGVEVDLPTSTYEELKALGVHVAGVGSTVAAEAAVSVKPRYHFAGGEGIFFQRQPYRNSGSHATRYIALGNVSTTKDKKRKWLHAISVEPLTYMPKDTLMEEPAGSTDCPYVIITGAGKRGAASAGVSRSVGGGVNKKSKVEPAWAKKIASEQTSKPDAGTFFWGSGNGTAQEAVDPTNTTVFVGNLKSGEITDRDLMAAFSLVAPVKSARIQPGSAYGFVSFNTHAEAARAIQSMEGSSIKRDRLRCSWGKGSQKKDERGRKGGEEEEIPLDPNNTTVFIGSLDASKGDISPDMLKEGLIGAGCKADDITAVRVAGRGFGFVQFVAHEAAAAAISSLNGAMVLGTSIKAAWGKQDSKDHRQKYPADLRKDCWFCLASPQLEDHLICSVAEEVYLAQPKGALVPDHTLIVPIAHTTRYSELTAAGMGEVEQYKGCLGKYYATKGWELLTFDRCVITKGANHMHIQAIPIPSQAARDAKRVLMAEARRANAQFEEVDDGADLAVLLSEGQYFYAEMPGVDPGSTCRMLYKIPEGARGRDSRALPLQFGRDVAASLLGMPERAHWKACAISKEQETDAAETFKEAFKGLDFALMGDEE
ncbi:unnamed protein product [Chrysoparadoxa australica]